MKKYRLKIKSNVMLLRYKMKNIYRV